MASRFRLGHCQCAPFSRRSGRARGPGRRHGWQRARAADVDRRRTLARSRFLQRPRRSPRRGLRVVDVHALRRPRIHSGAEESSAARVGEPRVLDERGTAPAAVDERMDGARGRTLRHRCRGYPGAAGQPAFPVRNVAHATRARSRGSSRAAPLRGHGRRQGMEPRAHGRTRRAIPALERFDMKPVMAFAMAIAVVALIPACAPRPADGVTVLTYASPYSPTHPFSRADSAWMKWISERSGGRMRIQPYWSSSVLSSEHSMTEIRHGVVDVGLITPIYARGGAHLIHVQAAYYAGLTTFPQQVALYRCLEQRDPQFGRELAGLEVLAVQGGNLPGIVTRNRPVNTLDDLRGLRLRAPAELLEVLRHFGADPVDMPMGEVYSALAKGVLDGVVAPADTLRSLHFAEVAHYFNTIRIPRGAYAARAMGEARWHQLTPAQQALLERGVAVWEHALATEIETAERAGERAGHEQGVGFFDMPQADQR